MNLDTLVVQTQDFSAVHGYEMQGSADQRMRVYTEWLKYDTTLYEEVILAGTVLESLPSIETWDQLWASFDVYADLHLLWRIRFSQKAVNKFKTCPVEKKERIIERLLELAGGRFSRNSVLEGTGPMRHMVVMSSKTSKEDSLFFALELNEIPVLEDQRVTSFAYHQFLRVVDITNSGSQTQSAYRQYLDEMRDDPAKLIRPEVAPDSSGKIVSFDNSVEALDVDLYGPKAMPNKTLSEAECVQYRFDQVLNRWTSNASRTRTRWEEVQTAKVNQVLISELADSESCKQLIKFFQSQVKSFPFQLSDEELDVVGTQGNVIAIGRSGTGKTTCAMLKLLACQALFRQRVRQHDSTNGEFFGLHIVFITASPTLTIEVKRSYETLVENLSNVSAKTVVEPSEDDETELNEKDLNIKPSMRLMTHKDFPMFSTTRLLVLAIDASLRKPYFQVTEDGGSTAVQAGFHNELKGVRVISHNLKREELDDNYDFQTQSFQLYAEKQEDNPVEEEKSISKKGKRLGEHVGFEVDFDYFHRHFWPTVRVKGSLSSSLIWSEIAGKLKGSAASSTFVNGYVPKEMYMTQNKKSSLLTAAEKESVWATFMQYERWKEEEGAYDFQDVVTHALKEIDLYGYEGAPVHFMMVDEVQDLTHATLLLLAKITEQNMFFSGDTAQTIARGVSFRFSDLNSLFASHEGLKIQPPVIKQLLVNYRSHNKILNLANCVVRLLELLFPKTIDKLERESSIYEGELLIPIVLMNPCLDDIVNALVVGETVVRGTVTFGSGQVVLVPDESARQRLPEILKGALCLTIYESKGLEFDDVILFEFFENCGVEESEWRMLRELLYEERSDTPADIYSPTWKPRFLLHFESAKHAALCTALKMLYVAITRTKRKFIVYDSSPSSKPLLDYMISIGIVTCKVAKESGLPTTVTEETSRQKVKTLWRNQGITMLKLKYYSQAAKCFGYASDERLRRKAELLYLADEAARLMQTAEAILSDSKSALLTRKRAETDVEKARVQFDSVAAGFLDIGQSKYAAQCFFSAGKFRTAANIYQSLKAWSELAHCLFEAGEYSDAGKCFIHLNNLLSALLSFEKGKDWLRCIEVLSRTKQLLPLRKRLTLIRKYCEQVFEPAPKFITPAIEKSQTSVPRLPVKLDIQSAVKFSRPEFATPTNKVSLSLSDRKSIVNTYDTEDQVLRVTLNTVLDVESCEQERYQYSYLSMEQKNWLPPGELVVPAQNFQNQQLIAQIIAIASLFQSESVELQGYSGAQIPSLKPIQDVEEAIIVLKALGLQRLAFILTNKIRKGDMVTEYMETVAVQVSSVHLIKASQRFGQQFEKYGKYWSGIAALKMHQCLEMIDSDLLLQIARPGDSMHSGLIILGYWKKVVSLTMDSTLASAFGDFQHVKLKYLKDRKLPLMMDSSTWEGHSSNPSECEVFLCILEETIAQANRFWQVTLNCPQIPSYKPSFHKIFPRNQILFEFIAHPDTFDQLEKAILGMFSKMKGFALDQDIQRDEFALADLFSFFTQLMFSYQLSVKESINILSFEWFEEIILSCKLWLRVFKPNDSRKSYMRGFYSMLRASLAPFGVRVLSGDVMVASLPIYTHLLVSSDCVFFSELVQRSVKMYPVDIEGNIFLVSISDVLTYLRLTLVKFLTEMVTNRKLLYEKHRQASKFPFRHQEQSNEQNRAKLAACVFGEISHLRTIQKMFPEEYRFVGRAVGDQRQVKNAREITKLQLEISELKGDEYFHDDPAFAKRLRNRNKAKIKDLETQKKSLLQENQELSTEETRETALSDYLESLPISIHNEMIWVYEHKIVLPKIAKMHLMAYITEKMSTFDYKSDIPKLRYLDGIARLCGCQPYLKSLIEEPKLSVLLFPEEDFAAGNLVEVIKKHLVMVTFPGMLREGLDIKEKFQIIQKCVLWSLILTTEQLLLPKLFALELTRSYEQGKKLFTKKVLKASNNIDICNSLHLLCDMLEALRPEDQCDSISHTVLLLTVTIITNTSWTVPFFAFSEVVRRLFFCIKRSPLVTCNSDLLIVAKVPMDLLPYLAVSFRRFRNMTESIKEIASELVSRPPQEEQVMFFRDTHSTEDEAVMLMKLTDEELQEATDFGVDRQSWLEGRDLESVVFSDYLNPALSQMRVNAYRKKTESASMVWGGMEQGNLVEESLSWDPSEKIQSDSDQLLLCDFQRKIVHFDVFQERKSRFNIEFSVIHQLSSALLSQIDVYHTRTQHWKQRMMIYANIKVLIRMIVTLRHLLLLTLLKPTPDVELEAFQLQESVLEANQVIESVSRTDLSNCGRTSTEEELSRFVPLQSYSNMKWKLTKQ